MIFTIIENKFRLIAATTKRNHLSNKEYLLGVSYFYTDKPISIFDNAITFDFVLFHFAIEWVSATNNAIKFRKILWKNIKFPITIIGSGFVFGFGMAWLYEYFSSLVEYEPFGLVALSIIFLVSILFGFVKSTIEFIKEMRFNNGRK